MKEHFISRKRSTAALAFSVLLFFCAATGGCHREVPGATVRGKVTYKKAPLDEGSVVFYPDGSGQVAYGKVQKDGTFQLLNAKKTVRIESGKYVAVVVAGTGQIAETREDPAYSAQPAVPLRFSSATTSTLKYEVVLGENNFDLDLDKP